MSVCFDKDTPPFKVTCCGFREIEKNLVGYNCRNCRKAWNWDGSLNE